MELMLLILAATYAFSGKYQKDTAVAAYKAGKEPPGLVKARMRHEAGGGKYVSRPGKSPKPKGPGATRLLIASRWAIACEKSKERGEDKLRRWRAWYQERAPQRDEQWRNKQLKKIQKRAERIDKWQGRWSATKNVAAATKDTLTGRDRGEQNTPGENTGTDQAGETTSPTTDLPAKPAAGEDTPNQPAGTSSRSDTASEPEQTDTNTTQNTEKAGQAGNNANNGGTPTATTTSSNTAGGIVNYQDAAAALRAAADRVEQYRNDLLDMADGLGGKHWGEEVHGDLRDMDGALQETAADYRDLATEMEQAGDAIRDAEDAHPYVPGQEVVNA